MSKHLYQSYSKETFANAHLITAALRSLQRGEIWIKAICPICGKEYEYLLEDYKPKTCGKFNCLQKFQKRGK